METVAPTTQAREMGGSSPSALLEKGILHALPASPYVSKEEEVIPVGKGPPLMSKRLISCCYYQSIVIDNCHLYILGWVLSGCKSVWLC